MNNKSLRVALLGVGNMGRNHLRILSMLKGVEVTYIYDLQQDRLAQLGRQYGVPYTTDLATALSGAEAVIIATPTSTHCELFEYCAPLVRFAFIEKPVAATVEEAEKIKALSGRYNVKVQIGFIERFNPVVSALKPMLDHERVINIDFMRTNRLSSRISDVDVVLDLMIHDIDLALYLNGPVKSVMAFGAKEHGLVAFANAMMVHESGAMSRILASRMTEKKIRQIQVTTDSSFIDGELLRKEVIINKQSEVIQDANKPYTIASIEQQVEVKPQEALLVELQSFIGLCTGESDQIPDIEAGLESLQLSYRVLEQIG
ncbi:Gfo/Idh/MocA family protein [Motiliproteus sediminis]|uniref:Gfo/Idh/MocA family protein n=1 Tax=Motiliproteus sediminis TaxID=1468178 RepID=UPI001AEF5FA7|nr:Gfo/Idh/MocA family oxidoreductase [Motiliproteus sediminis]